MDITKIFAILCGFLLIICLTLSITTLVVMRNAVEETTVWQNRAESLVNELDGCVEAMKNMANEDIPVLAPENDNKSQTNNRYCLRLNGESIGIYDSDEYLIEHLDINPILLPTKERELLSAGIWVESWKDLQKLIQNYA